MSGSPKYTTAQFAAQREAEFAAMAWQREHERQQRIAIERERHLATWRTALAARHGVLHRHVAALAVPAAAAGYTPAQQSLQALVASVGAKISGAANEVDVTRLDRELAGAEAQAGQIGSTIAAAIVQRQHQAAIDVLRTALDQEPDRAHLDPSGFADVRRLIDAAGQGVNDARRFPDLHRAASLAVSAHLANARQRSQDLARMARDADEAIRLARALLADLAESGAVLDGTRPVVALLTRLDASVAGEDVDGAAALTTQVKAATTALDESYERWAADQDRTKLIVEALVAALPRAGFQVVRGSLVADEAGARFAARKSDGSQMGIVVTAQDDQSTRIEYQVPGNDFTVEQVADGKIAVCDVTEQVLETLHTELGREDVETDGLYWAGKPRPDQRTARNLHTRTSGDRSA